MGCALGPADRAFFVLYIVCFAGGSSVAGTLCIVSEIVWTKCNMGSKWVSSGR